MPVIYYGNALYQWKVQRENVSKNYALISNFSENIISVDWLEKLNKLEFNLENGEMEGFTSKCKSIIKEEFELESDQKG
ncbi:MAG: hypothetical protein H0V82_08850 [Candidatus Protochlamydia sp.]|nr:hypothetical protein [Candidatus Protochlamydia sp.]